MNPTPARASSPQLQVLLLEATGSESIALAATARARGYGVHAITDPTTYATYPPHIRRLLRGHHLTDLTRQERVVRDIVGYAQQMNAAAILTTNEYLTELCAHACAALGLPGNDPERARAARNKAAMHEALTTCGATTPRTRITTTENELLNAANDLGYPCIVKPADAAGSTAVTILHAPADVGRAWRAVRTAPRMYGFPSDPRVLVQEHIDGPEFSVESLTHTGVTTHLCITTKTLSPGPHRVEIGHSLPTHLPPHLEHAIYHQVGKALSAVGIRNGASHTEVILSPHHGPTIIEIAARIGAGHIATLIHLALGINPWTALLNTALGRPSNLTPTHHAHAAIRFLTANQPGRLHAVHGLPTPGPDLPEVHLRRRIGDTIGPPTTNRDRLGHLILTSPDATALEHRADQLLADITIDVIPEPAPHAPPAT